MGKVSASVGGVSREAQELVEPKGKTTPESWQAELRQQFQSCSAGSQLKQVESKPQDIKIEAYRTLIKDLRTAHCAFTSLRNHATSGKQIGHARETEQAIDAQARTVSDYLKTIEGAYQEIPAAKREGLITPQQIRAELFPK